MSSFLQDDSLTTHENMQVQQAALRCNLEAIDRQTNINV